jgi:uncharacterized protein (DUF3820 family)
MTPEETLDHTPLCFGKYAGKTPDQISEDYPGYIVWLYENCTPVQVSRALYVACRDEVNERGDDDNPHF